LVLILSTADGLGLQSRLAGACFGDFPNQELEGWPLNSKSGSCSRLPPPHLRLAGARVLFKSHPPYLLGTAHQWNSLRRRV